jgi:hypothetical protein
LTIPSTLFQALREYYREHVFALLVNSNIKNRENLHELVLDNVAEHGWSADLQSIEDNFTPKSFKLLLEKLYSFHQKQRPLDGTTAMVTIDSTSKDESADFETKTKETKGKDEIYSGFPLHR